MLRALSSHREVKLDDGSICTGSARQSSGRGMNVWHPLSEGEWEWGVLEVSLGFLFADFYQQP